MLVITKITQAALFCRIHCSRKMDKFLRGRVGENFFIHILKSNYLSVKNYYKCHSGPKTPKSKPWGESPNFIWQMKEGYIGISKYKIFFKSVEGIFWGFSEISLTRVPPCPSTWHKYEGKVKVNPKKGSLFCSFVFE